MAKVFILLALVALFLHEVPAFDFTGLNFGNPLAGLFSNKRQTRQADAGKACSWWDIQKTFLCCKFPTPFSTSDTAICATKKRSQTQTSKVSRTSDMGLACIISCTLKRKDSLMENGTGNIEKLKAQFLAVDTTDEWKNIIKVAFDTCSNELQYTNISKEGDCQLTNLYFAYCLYNVGVKQCPDSSKMDLNECYNFYEKLSTTNSMCNPWPASVMNVVNSSSNSTMNSSSESELISPTSSTPLPISTSDTVKTANVV